MKLAIFTLNGHFNYGNRLQNYALQTVLQKYAVTVDTIWFEKNNYLPETHLWSKSKLFKSILSKKRQNFYKDDYVKNYLRQYNIRKFSDKYISIKYDYKLDPELDKQYDFFFVGSDQVWNPYSNYDNNTIFLNFAPPNKRIAYAASFGIEQLPNNKKSLFKDYLNNIPHISVREYRGAQIIKKLINRDVPVLVDPTMLLTKNEWFHIMQKPAYLNSTQNFQYNNQNPTDSNGYLLTYFLGSQSQNTQVNQFLTSLSNKYNLKIINLMDKSILDFYTTRVEEFLYLINNAKLVMTDSFHGTVFSIIMNTPFLVVNRSEKHGLNMNSRLDTLLNLFNFKDRFFNTNMTETDIFNMDFSNVESILAKERLRSINYLKKSMNLL